jgi:hypothetical protein
MPMPDVVVCDPSPWDFVKAERLNISIQQLSYISHLLYPQSWNLDQSMFKDLDNEYRQLIQRFDNNPIHLLNNVTRDCSQLFDYCQLRSADSYSGSECCSRLFTNVEYTLQYKCYSFGGKVDYSMLEAAQSYGITVSIKLSSENIHLDDDIAGAWASLQSGA